MHRPRLLVLLCGVLACSTVDRSGSSNYDEAGDDYPPHFGEEAAQSQPNGVTFTALDFAQPYSRLAVGNVARGVNEPGCCFDYALAGPTAEDVRVVFGGGSNDGLTFLDDRPDEVLQLGAMDDVLLIDLDEWTQRSGWTAAGEWARGRRAAGRALAGTGWALLDGEWSRDTDGGGRAGSGNGRVS